MFTCLKKHCSELWFRILPNMIIMSLSDEPEREIWKKGFHVFIKCIWKQILIRISFLYNKLNWKLTMRQMKQWIQNTLSNMPLFFMFLIFSSFSFQCNAKFIISFGKKRSLLCGSLISLQKCFNLSSTLMGKWIDSNLF